MQPSSHGILQQGGWGWTQPQPELTSDHRLLLQLVPEQQCLMSHKAPTGKGVTGEGARLVGKPSWRPVTDVRTTILFLDLLELPLATCIRLCQWRQVQPRLSCGSAVAYGAGMALV